MIKKTVDRLLSQYETEEWNEELLLAVYDLVSGTSMYDRPLQVNDMIVLQIEEEIERRSEVISDGEY